MLVTNKEILSTAKAEGYAVGAFNINNLETLLAVGESSIEERSPAIVAETPSAIEYAGLKYLVEMVKTATIREVLANSPKKFDPRKILGPAKEAIKRGC
jgi:tagatose 1,6-diphosphate aldolase GatY/KbaY